MVGAGKSHRLGDLSDGGWSGRFGGVRLEVGTLPGGGVAGGQGPDHMEEGESIVGAHMGLQGGRTA